jgi:hypothetical protein
LDRFGSRPPAPAPAFDEAGVVSGLHLHHVDGRLGPGLGRIDDALVVLLLAADHRRLHLVLADLDASWPREGEPLLVHRARRHAVTFGWAADCDMSLTFEPPAARALQHLWLDVLGALGGSS